MRKVAYAEVKSHPQFAQAMDERSYSCGELALQVGLHRSMIGHLRSGHRPRCRVDYARDIEDALGVPRGELFIYPVQS